MTVLRQISDPVHKFTETSPPAMSLLVTSCFVISMTYYLALLLAILPLVWPVIPTISGQLLIIRQTLILWTLVNYL